MHVHCIGIFFSEFTVGHTKFSVAAIPNIHLVYFAEKFAICSWLRVGSTALKTIRCPLLFSLHSLFTGLYSGPYFDWSLTPSLVEAQAGDDALLTCKVCQAGNRAVSQTQKRKEE